MTTLDAHAAIVRLTWPIAAWPNPNRDRRKHWTREREEARNIRAMGKSLGQQALDKHQPLTSPIHVTLTWAFPDRRERDLENWSSKALIDGIADSGLIAGDSTKHIARVTREVDVVRSEKGKLRVTVRIEEIERSAE